MSEDLVLRGLRREVERTPNSLGAKEALRKWLERIYGEQPPVKPAETWAKGRE